MQKGDTNKPFRIGSWLVEPGLNRVSDGDHVVALESRLMDTLVCLASRPGKIVSADELLDIVWHGRAHGDNSIYQAVAQLRKVLGEDVHHPRFIETIPKKGYRLICPVVPVVMDDELHATSGTGFGRRFVALAAGIALLAVAIILAVNPELRDRLIPADDGPSDRSVAVLPFIDMSEDGNQQYLGDGVAEELIHVLSNLPDLRVIARTSSFAFRDSNEDIRQIGRKLNVATILEGSIRKDGDRIRVTSQLANTRNGYHLWSKTFDRHSSDIFRIQNEIAVAVAKTFEYQDLDALAPDNLAARPDELQAYDFYLLGLHQLSEDTPSGWMLAIQHFERAIEMDPSFARAYAGLSRSYIKRYGQERDQELLDKAESAAGYAMLLDDQSAEVFEAVGRIKRLTRDFSGAEVAFRRAIALSSPNDVRPYLYVASQIRNQGREEEALVLVKNALELYPMSARVNRWLGTYYSTLPHGDWDLAFKYFKRAMDLDPDYRAPYRAVGYYYLRIGRLDQAIPYLSRIVDQTTGPTKAGLSIAALASAYVDIGDYTSAANLIRRAKELEPDHNGAINSEIHLQLARRDFSAARDIVHDLLPTKIDDDLWMSLLAFYEMVIGDTDHAEEIYARLAAAQEPDIYGEVNLYRTNTLRWGMLGAVNLAYLHKNNGDTRAAQELLGKAREYIESRIDPQRYIGSSLYVLAQIAAVEGNNDAAIEYVREAVEAGWVKAWFGRIDPIMADLRKDARYIQTLDEFEEKLAEMREHPKVLASNEP